MRLQVTPSVPKSPRGASTIRAIPLRMEPGDPPGFRQVQPRRRPSEHWLNSPAWIGKNLPLNLTGLTDFECRWRE